LLILLPGFGLWVAYGIASIDMALVVPNVVAFVVAAQVGEARPAPRSSAVP
jgi:hypothetical protein